MSSEAASMRQCQFNLALVLSPVAMLYCVIILVVLYPRVKPVTRTGYPQWGYYPWLMGNTRSWVRVRVSIGIPTGYPHRSLDVTPGDTWKPRLDGPAQGFLQCKPSPEPYRACYVRSSTCNSRLQGTVGSSREFWHLMTNEEVWGLSSNSSSKLKR